MKLSILIATLPERAFQLNRMMGLLLPQTIDKDLEVIMDDRPRSISTGQKRNDLIRKAQGDYICFVDDDDWISNDYVDQILHAITDLPDVVTMKGWMTTNGGGRVDWIIKLGEKYEARQDADLITRYYRFPNHLCAFKKEKIVNFQFPPIWQGEDYAWALQIHNSGVLQTEYHIDKQLYHYVFLTSK